MAPTPQQMQNKRIQRLSGKQPKARVQRYLKSQEPKLVEDARTVLLLKGIRCSDAMSTVLKDLKTIMAPHSKLLSKKNQILPFEDEGMTSLEFLTTKNDASLFAVASHNKKRPNNLVIGRTFDHRVLDVVELGITQYKSLADYKEAPKKRAGSKPLMLFSGDKWHLESSYRKLQNLLVDFYKGDPCKKMILSGVDHVITFTIADSPQQHLHNNDIAIPPTIHMRTYFVKLKKHPEDGSTPVPYLIPSGPDMDFKLRRNQFASPDMWKIAVKQPKELRPKKTKNQKTNIFGETIGRLHLERQDINQLGGKKTKALRVAEKLEADEEKKRVEEELEREKSHMSKEFEQTYGFKEDEMEE